jgi:hypothetical protein
VLYEDLSVAEARSAAARLLERIGGRKDWPLRWADEVLPAGWYLEGVEGWDFEPMTVEHLTRVILDHALRNQDGRV